MSPNPHRRKAEVVSRRLAAKAFQLRFKVLQYPNDLFLTLLKFELAEQFQFYGGLQHYVCVKEAILGFQ